MTNSNSQTTAEKIKINKSARKAVMAIVLFMCVYVLLVASALAVTAFCAWLGLLLIIAKPMMITIVLGAGIASIGVIVTIFLFKFIFSRHKQDRSHLTEITKEEEPDLFKMVAEVVAETGTKFPKKIYLSADVNAAVFYNSSFWSMIFPVSKNLQIGVGLMNSVTRTECKAIIAHEFGHFSQKSMTIGSYVYTINRVIYNMLYDNSSMVSLAEKWENVSSSFGIFIQLAFKIVEGIQWVLRKMYGVVNLHYMELSREMEFGADEVAAQVAGSQPMISGLERISLMSHALDSTIEFYNEKFAEGIQTKNIYLNHRAVYKHFAQIHEVPLEHSLPKPSEVEQGKYNKSKLIIKDLWSSHPETSDRVRRLSALAIPAKEQDNRLAITLFKNADKVCERITKQLFSTSKPEATVSYLSEQDFEKSFIEKYEEVTFPSVFNGYFDARNPVTEVTEPTSALTKTPQELFSNEVLDKVYTAKALKTDLEVLKQVNRGEIPVKNFIYDDMQYRPYHCPDVISRVNKELEELEQFLKTHDNCIYMSYKKLAEDAGQLSVFIDMFSELARVSNGYDDKEAFYQKIADEISFTNRSTPFEEITQNFKKFEATEEKLKSEINSLMQDKVYGKQISAEVKKNFEAYCRKSYSYFDGKTYDNESLSILFSALNGLMEVASKGYFHQKRDLLRFLAGLTTTAVPAQAAPAV